MKRVNLTPRENWQKRLEDAGCEYHTIDGQPYWRDDAAYVFTAAEIDKIEEATDTLHHMCMEHVGVVVQAGDYDGYGFPDAVKELIDQSWDNGDRHLYGRFDLGYDGTNIKMFEYNADTPTSLPEASVWQWHALEDRGWPDQFNSIHERLVAWWKAAADPAKWLYFAAQREGHHEDWGNIHYLLETATEAGFARTASLSMDEIGWNGSGFTDLQERPIEQLFKLYPWEWMMADEFGWKVQQSGTRFIEPAWKMLLSTKALLPKLWQRHPNHPLLLEAHFDHGTRVSSGQWVRKPMLGREGANISLENWDRADPMRATGEVRPEYDKHGYVYQREFKVPSHGEAHQSLVYPVLGAWVIGDEPAGLGIREDTGFITTNTSCFVPHYFEG